ncbi:MAG: hypothetical protein V2A69_15710 [Pseudomonadota bacterium]
MNEERIVAEGIYLIGGPTISDPEDATAFIINCGKELVIVIRLEDENVVRC